MILLKDLISWLLLKDYLLIKTMMAIYKKRMLRMLHLNKKIKLTKYTKCMKKMDNLLIDKKPHKIIKQTKKIRQIKTFYKILLLLILLSNPHYLNNQKIRKKTAIILVILLEKFLEIKKSISQR
jgi:hypothetical protein